MFLASSSLSIWDATIPFHVINNINCVRSLLLNQSVNEEDSTTTGKKFLEAGRLFMFPWTKTLLTLDCTASSTVFVKGYVCDTSGCLCSGLSRDLQHEKRKISALKGFVSLTGDGRVWIVAPTLSPHFFFPSLWQPMMCCQSHFALLSLLKRQPMEESCASVKSRAQRRPSRRRRRRRKKKGSEFERRRAHFEAGCEIWPGWYLLSTGDNHIPSEHCKNAFQAVLGVYSALLPIVHFNPDRMEYF